MSLGMVFPIFQQAAKQIIEDIPEGKKPGREALEAALAAKGTRIVNYDDWLNLDAHEKEHAREGSPREKLITVLEPSIPVLNASGLNRRGSHALPRAAINPTQHPPATQSPKRV